MSKRLRADEETHAALSALKRENEMYDDGITRLLEERNGAVVEGAGLWDGSNAATAAREARERSKRSIGQ